MTRIAIQGVPGAFSQIAGEQVFEKVEVVSCAAFDDLIEAVMGGEAEAGLVPVENTLAGSVQRNLERIRSNGLEVVAETRVRIELCLIGRPGADLEGVRTAASHPVALEQCRTLFTQRGIEGVPAYDTAGSVEQLMEGVLPADAAVASRLAAELYGGQILAAGIEDDTSNFTRFLVVRARGSETDGLKARALSRSEASSNTNLKATTSFVLPHEPGSLAVVIGAFARRGLNLTRIESWPIPGSPWEYRFFVDLVANESEPLEEMVLEAAAGSGAHITVMGVYRAAGDMATAGLEPATPTM